MKKLSIILGIVALGSVIFYACEKAHKLNPVTSKNADADGFKNSNTTSNTQTFSDNYPAKTNMSAQSPCYNASEVSYERGLLKFVDMDAFKTCLECLEKTTIQWDKAFVNANSDLSIEECLCRSQMRDAKMKVQDDRRIKWSISHWTYFWNTERSVTAKTKNYKKRQHGGWKLYRTYCEAMVFGKVSDTGGECDGSIDFNPTMVLAFAVAKKVKQQIHVATETKCGWVQGFHKGAEGITHNSTL